MAQTYTEDLYEQSYVADTTLTNMENNFAALKSSFSGGAAPSNPVGFQLWGDTTLGDECLKVRNDANTAWLAVMVGDVSQKIWIYRNDTNEGWVVDATVTDQVLAIKGGANAYNVNGGVNAGTWTQPGHTLAESEIPAHSHTGTATSSGAHTHTDGMGTSVAGGAGTAAVAANETSGGGNLTVNSDGAHTHPVTGNSTGGGGSHNHGDTYRPAAAVGTLQYPDL